MNMENDAIANFFDQESLPYKLDREKSVIYLSANLEAIGYKIISLRFIGSGDILEISLPELFQVDNKVFKGILMQKLLELQKDIILLKFYLYTLDNGQQWIGVYLEIPLFEISISQEQLYAYLNFLINKIKNLIPRLQHILATGKEPQKKSKVEELLDEMSPEAIEQLTKLLEKRKKS